MSYGDTLSGGLTTLALGAATATGVAAIAAYMLDASRYPALEYPFSVDNQSVELENGVRTSNFAPDGKLVSYFYEDATTLYEGFKRGVEVSKGGPCLGTRTGPNKEYQWITYEQVYTRAKNVGSGLIQRGLSPDTSTFIGIYSQGNPEWVISEQACNMFSMVVVPLYDTLGTEACSYIVNQTAMTTVICDKAAKALSLLKAAKDTPSLKTIILFEKPNDEVTKLATEGGVEVLTIAQLEEIGANNLQTEVPPKPADLATICYTSGTTGNPKGVMLSHQNIMSNTAAVLKMASNLLVVTPEDIHISYLPLAHMFERLVQCMVYQHGARVGFFRGDVKLLMEDLVELKPTIFPTVPRLLNRMYDKVMQGIQGSALKTFLFNLALNQKMALLKKGIQTKESIWDKLVFGKIQKMLGGRVRFVVTGSAPLASNVLNFSRCAFGCMVLEGYGQTEATAGVTVTYPHEYQGGLVGSILPCNLIKLVDVPEMEYYAKDSKGEVCCKGSNCMMGYYKDPEKTAEAIDSDGWLHTGDVGQFLPNGALKIIDRRKHIFKLAQGEYLAPEKIEGVYMRSQYVAQIFVDGDSLQIFPVAVIVPDPDVLPKWAKQQGLTGDMEALCKNQTVNKTILQDVNRIGKEAGLKGFEQVKYIYLFPELFSVENNLLTPTFKSKRPALRKFFAKQIEEMYAPAS